MDEGGSKDDKQIEKQKYTNSNVQRHVFVPSTILQSIWVRCRSIFPTATDGKFMESELRFVLYSGFIFWGIHLLHTIFT
jgi:hypothetical protein